MESSPASATHPHLAHSQRPPPLARCRYCHSHTRSLQVARMGQAQGVVRMSEGVECHCACGEGPIPARFNHGRQAGRLEGGRKERPGYFCHRGHWQPPLAALVPSAAPAPPLSSVPPAQGDGSCGTPAVRVCGSSISFAIKSLHSIALLESKCSPVSWGDPGCQSQGHPIESPCDQLGWVLTGPGVAQLGPEPRSFCGLHTLLGPLLRKLLSRAQLPTPHGHAEGLETQAHS